MANHTQPTQEELQAQLDKSQKELENPPAPTPSEEVPSPSEAIPSPSKPDEEETPSPSKPDEDEAEETRKRQLAESGKEARKLAEDSKRMNEAFHEANNLNDPTEDDLKKEYPEWDVMTDLEKRLAKDNLSNKRRFEVIQKRSEERRVVEEWFDKVDSYIEDPKTLIANPGLEGKEDSFKAYAKSKEMRNINLSVVVKSFLFDNEVSKVKHKGKMFETGHGGDKKPVKPVSDKLTVEQGRELMKTDYQKYKRLLIERKIATE